MHRVALVVLASLLVLGTAEAGKRSRGGRTRLNMPPAWTWPPSPEMRAEGQRCLERLTELGVSWKRAPAQRKIVTPIYLPQMEVGGVKLTSIWRKGPFVMDCLLALSFAERGAEALRSAGVAELRFTSIHSYRTVAGTRHLSRHALGMAIDVFEVVTDDGLRHSVKHDYHTSAALLSAERWINEAGGFRFLLTPGNDPRRHHDHFHFEARSAEEQRRVDARQRRLQRDPAVAL
jgi:hypothetical protein